MDKVSLQKGNKHTIKIMSKNETLTNGKFHALKSSMRTLEWNTKQEIQTLLKAVVKRFEKIEEIIETDDQGQKVKGQEIA